MQVMDIDAGSFRDWLCMVDEAGWPRSCGHCPMALFLDEIEGGEHFVDCKDRQYFAGLSNRSEPTGRLDPGEIKLLPEWAQWFLPEIDTFVEETIEPPPIPGGYAAEVLDWALEEQQRQV